MRDPEGRAGLFRAMEPISVPESNSGGAEISRPLGFLALGGRDGDLVLEPDDRFKGSRESESWQAASRKRLLCSEGRGELGDRDGDREEEGEADEMLAAFGSIKEEILAETDEARKASDVEGRDTTGLLMCLSVLLVTNLMTVLTSSTGGLSSGGSSSFSVLMALKGSGGFCRELMVKDEYRPEWMYSLRLVLLRADRPCLCASRPSGGALQSLSCSSRLSRLISMAWGSIFRISGKETNLYTNFCPITFLMMFCGSHKRRHRKGQCPHEMEKELPQNGIVLALADLA